MSGALSAWAILSGDARVRLVLKDDAVRWHEPLEARLELEAERSVHVIASAQASLSRSWSGEVVENTELLPEGHLLLAGELLRRDFRLRMPWGAPFSEVVSVAVSIRSWSGVASLEAGVRPLPPADCARAAHELAAEAGAHVDRWSVVGQGVAADLSTVDRDRPYRYLRLELYPRRGMFRGVVFASRRKPLLGSIVRGAEQVRQVEFGRRNADSSRRQFRAIVEELRWAFGPNASLPIAASPRHVDPDALPVPAGDLGADG
jgi:hypothetical protein